MKAEHRFSVKNPGSFQVINSFDNIVESIILGNQMPELYDEENLDLCNSDLCKGKSYSQDYQNCVELFGSHRFKIKQTINKLY